MSDCNETTKMPRFNFRWKLLIYKKYEKKTKLITLNHLCNTYNM